MFADCCIGRGRSAGATCISWCEVILSLYSLVFVLCVIEELGIMCMLAVRPLNASVLTLLEAAMHIPQSEEERNERPVLIGHNDLSRFETMGNSKNRNEIKAVLKKAIVRWHLVQLMQILQNEMPSLMSWQMAVRPQQKTPPHRKKTTQSTRINRQGDLRTTLRSSKYAPSQQWSPWRLCQ